MSHSVNKTDLAGVEALVLTAYAGNSNSIQKTVKVCDIFPTPVAAISTSMYAVSYHKYTCTLTSVWYVLVLWHIDNARTCGWQKIKSFLGTYDITGQCTVQF